jgi:uncharacterized protein YidB (DUF937 family)
MDSFEKVFEDLDVKTEELNGALEGVYSTTIDEGEVNGLLNEMKDAHGMEIGGGLANANNNKVNAGQQDQGIDEMQKKLDQLKHL